jgi:hypothetical protein
LSGLINKGEQELILETYKSEIQFADDPTVIAENVVADIP